MAHPEKLKERFGIAQEALFPIRPRYNVRPTQTTPVILRTHETTLALMRWGLIPHWAKEEKMGARMINARAETVDTLGTFKKLFRTQRCLIPAGGFYEWQETKTGKLPYYFHLTSRDLFGLAGLYDTWLAPTGEAISSYTVITTTPNATVGRVHNRMPVILAREQEQVWLDPALTDTTRLKALLVPYPDTALEAYPVSKQVNHPHNDRQELLSALGGGEHGGEEARG